jgi:predicted dehydrogenase
MEKRLRVGIIGLGVERGWATAAHIPALHALSDDFELAGVANTTLVSPQAAAAAFGLPRAFESTAELVASPDIDVVVVTVKVPYHQELVSEALNAGKRVYCEWPLGNGLAEAVELARLAYDRKLLGVVGTQAIASPEVEYARKVVMDGYVGEVLSATYVGAGLIWGNDVPRDDLYAMDSKNPMCDPGTRTPESAFNQTLARKPFDQVGETATSERELVTRPTAGNLLSTAMTSRQSRRRAGASSTPSRYFSLGLGQTCNPLAL